MKLLLILFVVLTLLSTLCTGRTISKELCDKIETCKQLVIITSTTPEPAQEQTVDKSQKPLRIDKLGWNRGIPDDNIVVQYSLMNSLVCPGGAPKLRSGMCPSPDTWSNDDNVLFYFGNKA